jgi:hypothetical protein
MAALQKSKILDAKARALLEDLEGQIGEAIAGVIERNLGRVDSMVEQFGKPIVGMTFKHYPITVKLGGTLFRVFQPMVSGCDHNEDSWDVDEEV